MPIARRYVVFMLNLFMSKMNLVPSTQEPWRPHLQETNLDISPQPSGASVASGTMQINTKTNSLDLMVRGELCFKDGSSLMGDYRITPLKPGLKSLIFTTTDVSRSFIDKEPDVLRSSTRVAIATGLMRRNAQLGRYQTIWWCEFIVKS
jgi:hypothetical protein